MIDLIGRFDLTGLQVVLTVPNVLVAGLRMFEILTFGYLQGVSNFKDLADMSNSNPKNALR